MIKFAAEQLRKIQSLLLDLFDGPQMRKFVSDWGGRSIAHQIPPEVVSSELLAHGVTAVLDRNGMIDGEFFIELYRERPNCRPLIEQVAQECGLPLRTLAPNAQGTQVISVRTPDYVVQNAYESLRAQRDRLRTFFQGPVSIHGFVEVLGKQQDLIPVLENIRAWIRDNAGAFAFAPVRNTLHQLGLLAAGFTSRDPAVQGLTAMAALFLAPQLEGHLRSLARFAQLTESELYAMALQELEPR